MTSDANSRIAFALHYDDKDGTGTQETHTYTVTGCAATMTPSPTMTPPTPLPCGVIDDGLRPPDRQGHLARAMVFRNVYAPKATSITLAAARC